MQPHRIILALLAALCLAATAPAQTVKALSYNTNGVVIYSSTNILKFTNAFKFGDDLLLSNNTFYWGTNARWSPEDNVFSTELQFDSTNIAATTRTNLGLHSTNVYVYAATALWDNVNEQVGLRLEDMDVSVSDAMIKTNGPTDPTNAVGWIRVLSGTNVYKLPLYQ